VTLFTSYQRRVDEAREHEEVYQAIRGRDPDRAYMVMMNHEINVLNYVKEKIIPMLF
jgi:DNA-binding GntR family transcriptional regulator